MCKNQLEKSFTSIIIIENVYSSHFFKRFCLLNLWLPTSKAEAVCRMCPVTPPALTEESAYCIAEAALISIPRGPGAWTGPPIRIQGSPLSGGEGLREAEGDETALQKLVHHVNKA